MSKIFQRQVAEMPRNHFLQLWWRQPATAEIIGMFNVVTTNL
jgi:hypothetical protein